MGRGYQCRRVRPYPCSALGVDQVSLDVYLTCPCCEETVYDANITHNLGKVATSAGTVAADEARCDPMRLVCVSVPDYATAVGPRPG